MPQYTYRHTTNLWYNFTLNNHDTNIIIIKMKVTFLVKKYNDKNLRISLGSTSILFSSKSRIRNLRRFPIHLGTLWKKMYMFNMKRRHSTHIFTFHFIYLTKFSNYSNSKTYGWKNGRYQNSFEHQPTLDSHLYCCWSAFFYVAKDNNWRFPFTVMAS